MRALFFGLILSLSKDEAGVPRFSHIGYCSSAR
jgi:hypothetical protein